MTDITAPADGGQGTTPPASLATPPPATPPAAPAIPWLDGADEVTVGYVQNKGWSEPKQVLDGYRNLEKLLGADRAGNTVVLPKPDAPQAEVDAFYTKLGRPADATGYKLEIPPVGGDPDFAKTAAGWFHELGLSQKQGEGVAAKWNEFAKAQMEASERQQQTAFEADDKAVRDEWGQAFNQNLVMAQAAARGLGIDEATLDKLQDSLGHKAVMNLFYKIGSKIGEPGFVTGSGDQKFGSVLTPGQAKAKIQELQADKAFGAKYVSGDAEARAEMKRLHEFAYPSGAK
jgi:hypothetical protein